MKNVEKSILMLKTTLNNFMANTSGLKAFCHDFSNCNKIIYDKYSVYGSLGNDISECHNQVERNYEDLVACSQDLNLATTEWKNIFNNAKVKIINLVCNREKRRI